MREPRPATRVGGPMKRLSPMALAAIAGGAILLLVLAILLLRGGSGNQDRLGEEGETSEVADEPATRCSSQRTYDLIKRELFRQAARVRGSDQAAFDRISSFSSIRMERPVLRSSDDGLESVGCSGLLTLDLPPGVAVVGGRRSLSAEVTYIVQQAADQSGDLVMLEGADSIIVPLATLARTGAEQPSPDIDQPPADALGSLNEIAPDIGPQPTAPAEPEPVDPPTTSAQPSYDCGNARTRSEIAVCQSPALAALDRQMAAQFSRGVDGATREQRALLERTRSRFLQFRDGCRSDDCIADTYRGRIREIDDIMAGRWRRPR